MDQWEQWSTVVDSINVLTTRSTRDHWPGRRKLFQPKYNVAKQRDLAAVNLIECAMRGHMED